MPRSLKKGPFVDDHLLKKVDDLNEPQREARHQDLVAPLHDHPRDGRPHHRRPRRPQARARVHHRVDGRAQARRVRAHPHLPVPRRPGAQGTAADERRSLDTNEVARHPGRRMRYARLSAYKARRCSTSSAARTSPGGREILRFTERGAAEVIAKVLDSAVANAEHNDGHRRRRALRGRRASPTRARRSSASAPAPAAGRRRIRKRTCHITSSWPLLDADELDRPRARPGGGPRSAARRQRTAVPGSPPAAAPPARPSPPPAPTRRRGGRRGRHGDRRRRGRGPARRGRSDRGRRRDGARPRATDETVDDDRGDGRRRPTEAVDRRGAHDRGGRRARRRGRSAEAGDGGRSEARGRRRRPSDADEDDVARPTGDDEEGRPDGPEGQPVRVPARRSPPTGSRAGSATASTPTTSSRTGRSATTS